MCSIRLLIFAQCHSVTECSPNRYNITNNATEVTHAMGKLLREIGESGP